MRQVKSGHETLGMKFDVMHRLMSNTACILVHFDRSSQKNNNHVYCYLFIWTIKLDK